jgi:hypothetical protein
MRVLLYDAQSDRYFQSPQGWTEDPNLALDLGGTVQAVNVAYQQKLQSAEIILAFDDAHLNDMRLPLNLNGELASNWKFPAVAAGSGFEKPAV